MDRVPVRSREFVVEEGHVVVLVPRFDGWLGRWITRHLTNPCYRIKLDRLGSEVWNALDGVRTVREIAHELRRKLGEQAEPAEQRVNVFVRRLDRARCIRFAKEKA